MLTASYELISSPFIILSIALLLDMLIGEPALLWSRLPHPVVLFGKAISALERRLNKRSYQGKQRRLYGVLAISLWVGLAAFTGWVIMLVAGYVPAPFGLLLELVIVAILLAGRSLYDHIAAVMKPLAAGDVEGARFAVSMIVGRDTSRLDQSDITRAAIETGAENLSDGVIAPAIWYLIGGLPLLLAYKMINTADSMVGYKSARFYAFGWGAAVLDDIVNFFPARLTAWLIIIIALFQGTAKQAQQVVRDDAHHHASPNAGYPEAAMAGALDIRLGGVRWYRGHLLDLPAMNADGKDALSYEDIDRCLSVLWSVLWLSAILCCASVFLFLQ